MTKNSFWRALVINLEDCQDCPFGRNDKEICREYSESRGESKIAPCFNPEAARKAYENMEDEE